MSPDDLMARWRDDGHVKDSFVDGGTVEPSIPKTGVSGEAMVRSDHLEGIVPKVHWQVRDVGDHLLREVAIAFEGGEYVDFKASFIGSDVERFKADLDRAVRESAAALEDMAGPTGEG